jgi:hypothetical protein
MQILCIDGIPPSASEPYLADTLKDDLAGFAPGSKRQSERKKCATAMRNGWHQAAVTHLCSLFSIFSISVPAMAEVAFLGT